MAKNDFQYGGWNSYTCNVARSWHWFRQVTAPCNVACGSGIVTVTSPSGSTLHCDKWLWNDMPLNSPDGSTLQCGKCLLDDMPWNSPKHRPYWNSRYGFKFDRITTVDMSFCTSLRNYIQIGPPQQKKMTSCRFLWWRISATLNFMGPIIGSLKSPCTTSYRLSINTMALNCLVFFEKMAFLI